MPSGVVRPFSPIGLLTRAAALLKTAAALLTILVVLPCTLFAQQNTKVSYEGQKIATIELVANPKISVDNLKPLVQIKPGDSYSSRQVQQTISALQSTGNFTKIDLSVVPDPAGLRITFTLEPALYFGIFDFPGATKTFTYSRLLQVVDIPEQTAYKEDLVAKAGGDLLKFFISTGYFQAQVRSEPRFDEHYMLANVTFHVTLGKKAKVGKLIVSGPEPAQAQRLVHDAQSFRALATGASLKPGKRYSPKRINSAIALMKRDLTKQHRLASVVRFDHAEYHPDTNRADVLVNAQLGPVINVKITGAKLTWLPFLTGRKEKQLIPIFQENSVDPDLVEEGRRNIADFFQNKGYFDVKVTTDYKTSPNRVDLVYSIDKGARHTVQTVAFRGNRHIDEDDLEPLLAVQPHHFLFSHGKYSDKLVRQTVRNIETFYKDHGYEDVKVSPDVVDREPKIYVAFQIAEGPQTVVENLNLRGNRRISGLELAPKGGFNLRSGQPFSPKGLENDRNHIMATYLDHGFLNADFASHVRRLANDPHRIEVDYDITERQQVHVGDVVLLGNKSTRPKLITTTAKIPIEAPLSMSKLMSAESDLYDLGIFDWANVSPRRTITDQTDEDVLVEMHEAKKNTITYGFGMQVARRGGNLPSGTIALPGLPPVFTGKANFTAGEKTFVSPRGSIQYSRNNLWGKGQTMSVSALFSRLDQRAVASLTDPHFRYSSWNSLFSVSLERNTENPVFTARLGEATWQLEKPLNKDKSRRVQLRYRFRRTVLSNLTIPDLVLPQDQRLHLSTLSATWIRDTRDKPLDAHKGIYQTVDLGITPRALGSNANFARLLAQSSYYQPWWKMVFANRITLGLAKSFANSDVPTSERFFSGGETTLRGFPINGAGPQRTVPACGIPGNANTCINIRVPVGGDQLFIYNSELRFPLGLPIDFAKLNTLGAAVFYDGGNVYGPIGVSHFIQNFTNTVGVGLRYPTPLGPIRFDIGRNLNPVTGVKATQFYITVGQAF